MLKITKRDLIFCMVALLFAGCFCVLFYANMQKSAGDTVDIFCAGEQVASLDLGKNQNFELSQENRSFVLQIKDGYAFVHSSACSGQDCVHSAPISKAGQIILCAPQQILVKISSQNAPDAVAK